MKRFTFISDGYYAIDNDNCFEDNNEDYSGPAINQLAEYENAAANDMLVILPCKPGEHLWIDGREAIVEEFFGYETERYLHCQFYDNYQYIDVPFEEIGKTVFTSQDHNPEDNK